MTVLRSSPRDPKTAALTCFGCLLFGVIVVQLEYIDRTRLRRVLEEGLEVVETQEVQDAARLRSIQRSRVIPTERLNGCLASMRTRAGAR